MEKTRIYGNLYYSDCGYCEELSVKNINLVINGIYSIVDKKEKLKDNGFRIKALKRDGLYIVNNPEHDLKAKNNGLKPAFRVDGEDYYSRFFVCRADDSGFVDLTNEDYRYLEALYSDLRGKKN